MTDSKISALSAGGALLATDQLVVARSGANDSILGQNVPGFEFDYVTRTTSLTITATTEGTAEAFIDGNAVTYDGSTRVLIEHYCPWISITTSQAVVPVLLDGSTVLGWFGQLGGGGATAGASLSVYGAIFATPSAASHTYHVKYFKTGGTGSANAGAGGTGNNVPAYLRITKA